MRSPRSQLSTRSSPSSLFYPLHHNVLIHPLHTASDKPILMLKKQTRYLFTPDYQDRYSETHLLIIFELQVNLMEKFVSFNRRGPKGGTEQKFRRYKWANMKLISRAVRRKGYTLLFSRLFMGKLWTYCPRIVDASNLYNLMVLVNT